MPEKFYKLLTAMSFFLKATGCIMLVVSATTAGFVFSQRLKTRCNFLAAFMDFMCNLETNIRFSGEDIFSLIDKSVNNNLLNIFKSNNYNSVTEHWSGSLNKIPTSYGVTKDDINMLQDFGSILGTTDTEGQISHIQLYKTLFNSQLKKAENDYKTKSKLYKVLGFFTGSAIALMII